MALGFTLIFGVLRLLNLVHGEIYMVGAYIGFFLLTVVKLHFLAVIFLVSVTIYLIGVLIERSAFRPLRDQPHYIPMISTIAVSIILQEAVRLVWSPQAVLFPDLMNQRIGTGNLSVSLIQIVTIVVGVVAMLIFHFFLGKTRLGRAIRATSEDQTASVLMGVNINRIISVTFGVGSVLAGIAGVLIGLYYSVAYPTMGFIATFRAFVISVVGGMGSIPGAVLAGYCLGLIDSFSVKFFDTGVSESIPFLILIVFLILRPTGIFGGKDESTGGSEEESSAVIEEGFFIKGIRSKPWVVILIFAIAISIPFIFPSYYVLRMAFLVAIYGILAVGLNFVMGYIGQLTLCHASFYAVGAYTTALLSLRLNVPFSLALPASCMTGFIFGVLVGLPSLRLRGYYLALVSLGFGELVKVVLVNWYNFTGGPNGLRGIPSPTLFSFQISSQEQFYLLALFFLFITCLVAFTFQSSLYGRSLIAIKNDELAALAVGVPVTRYKVLAFAISGLFAGLAGSLYAYYASFVSPELGDFWETVIILSMVVIGGLGNIIGSLVGAAIFILLPEFLRFIGEVRMLLVGIVILILIIYKPRGLIPMKVTPRLRFPIKGTPS